MTRIPITYFEDRADGSPISPFRVVEPHRESLDLQPMREAQTAWAGTPIRERLRCIRRIRHALAEHACDLVRAVSPQTEAESAEIIAAQLLPLADACRFLEHEAPALLQPRRLGLRGQPFWLRPTGVELRREPYGIILIITPGNYPLLLPGVVLLQALAAGNAVLLKPAAGGTRPIGALVSLCLRSGVPAGLLRVLPEETRAVASALEAGVDKVVFTGSADTGRKLLAQLASRLIPSVMELSGCDALFIRADADLILAAKALLFGLRWNHGATCIAPRRVFVHERVAAAFEAAILSQLPFQPTWTIPPELRPKMAGPVLEAAAQGARIIAGEIDPRGRILAPLIVADASPSLRLLREDHFGPVAALVTVRDDEEALCGNAQCPFALGASIFTRDLVAARALAARINAGTVVINDLIVPTADPRVPFGGRQESGFGVTRGAEGLLELTVPKTVLTRPGRRRPHYDPLTGADAELFRHYLTAAHGARWWDRLQALGAFFRAASQRKKS